MYRKPAPRPFDERLIARWRGGLRGRTRVFRIWQYGPLWVVPFVAIAIGCLYYSTETALHYELVCTSRDHHAHCRLLRESPLHSATPMDVFRISAHDRTVGDENRGPKILVECDKELPMWFREPRAQQIVGDLMSVSKEPEGTERRASLATEGAYLGLIGGAAFCLVLAAGMAYSRTKLLAHSTTRTLTVHRRSLAGNQRQVLSLDRIGRIDIQSVDDSSFERLTFGTKKKRISVLAMPGACRKGKEFLEEVRSLGAAPPEG